MQIQEAIGDIGVPRIAELASEAPTLAGDEIVAACIHEAEEPPGPVGRGNESVKVLAVRNDGTLLMISWTGADYTGERVPRRNVARMRMVVPGDLTVRGPACSSRSSCSDMRAKTTQRLSSVRCRWRPSGNTYIAPREMRVLL
jgi:hypothetical protein